MAIGWVRSVGVVLLSALIAGAQTSGKPVETPPIPMPADRAVESYRIYSKLMPVGELGNKGWPRKLWLIQETTINVVGAGKPCLVAHAKTPIERAMGGALNPHNAVTPDEQHVQDYNEILDDFDQHCHDILLLTREGWQLGVPFRIVNAREQEEFAELRDGGTHPVTAKERKALVEKYEGAPGISSFSEVYFNVRHTVALVYAWGECGNLCGQGFWVALELQNGQWKELPWRSILVQS